MTLYLISSYKGHRFLAVKKENRVTDLFFEEETDAKVGNIYLAKVVDLVRNTGGAFLSLGEEKAFLQLKPRELKEIRPQDELMVQVTKSAMKSKEIRVSRAVSIPGKYLVLSSEGEGISISKKIGDPIRRQELTGLLSPKKAELEELSCAVVVRTQALTASGEEILSELGELMETFSMICRKAGTRTCYSLLYEAPGLFEALIRDEKGGHPEKVITDDPELFRSLSRRFSGGIPVKLHAEDISLGSLYSLESAVEEALQKRVWLKSGAYLVIEYTEALTVIDVNTGKNIKKHDREESFLKINLEAAEETARQLRLRNLSGIILVDFINMEDKGHRRALMERLSELFKEDPVQAEAVDMTKLGLLEITRKKVRKPLHEVLLSDHGRGEARD